MASIKDLVFTLRIGTANIFPVNVISTLMLLQFQKVYQYRLEHNRVIERIEG
jgi:hypothetical protein